MKRNEKIFISLEIQKVLESKGLLLSIQFDKNAPNFRQENEMISWCPTYDELDFITEAFSLIGGRNVHLQEKEEIQQDNDVSSEVDKSNYSRHASDIRIAPLSNNMGIEEMEDLQETHSKEKGQEEKVFIQADEKKIDEILKRKKHNVQDQYNQDTDGKAIIDKMTIQKKKK